MEGAELGPDSLSPKCLGADSPLRFRQISSHHPGGHLSLFNMAELANLGRNIFYIVALNAFIDVQVETKITLLCDTEIFSTIFHLRVLVITSPKLTS